MQILHPFAGSIQSYAKELIDLDRYRPNHCPQCQVKQPLIGHGFYCRTLVDGAFDGVIRVRRSLCRPCKRTVSLLPDFALPWLRFSVSVIALFLVARLLQGLTPIAAAEAATLTGMPYQRGQFWIRRFQKQAPALSLALAPLSTPGRPPDSAPDFVSRALQKLQYSVALPGFFPTLQVRLCSAPSHGSGSGWSLLLSCMTLSFTTSRRFIPTLSKLKHTLQRWQAPQQANRNAGAGAQ